MPGALHVRKGFACASLVGAYVEGALCVVWLFGVAIGKRTHGRTRAHKHTRVRTLIHTHTHTRTRHKAIITTMRFDSLPPPLLSTTTPEAQCNAGL